MKRYLRNVRYLYKKDKKKTEVKYSVYVIEYILLSELVLQI